MQIFDHGVSKLATATLGIKIFVPKDECAALVASALGAYKECASMSEVQIAGGRRSESTSV